MIFRGILAATVLTAGVLLSARFVLEDTGGSASGPGNSDHTTLSIAPISLGNPAAAAALHIYRSGFTTGATSILAPAPLFHKTLTAGRGDTLSGMLTKAGIPARDSDAAIVALRKHFNPGRLRQGQRITINFQADGSSLADSETAAAGTFTGLSLLPNQNDRVIVARNATGEFRAKVKKRALTETLSRASNTITYSLSQAGSDVRVPNSVMTEMIRLYSWDVDFQRDIRKNDNFEVLYESYYDSDGELAHNGDIVYASLTLSGKRHAVYRYVAKDGTIDYFDEYGQSARKALMRTPIDGARLSSGFGKRKHPILGYTKMHTGIDFAAPRGTPIYAAGNGTVVYAGKNGGYGNYVRIRHNAHYSTAYAHMKKLNTKKGRHVKQGQVIGYVGTTGRSTGPHLHYEILLNKRPVNPLRVKMPSGRKLKGDELTRFQIARTNIDTQYAAADIKLEVASGE